MAFILIGFIALIGLLFQSGAAGSGGERYGEDGAAELARQMSDPYRTPGVDLVVDEHYHGIDRGMGYVNPHSFD